MIDYRDLLQKYLSHISAKMAGDCLLSFDDLNYTKEKVKFSQEEIEALWELEISRRRENWKSLWC